MQSQNGDVQLSVTLDTKGIKSDVQKLKNEIQKEVDKRKISSDDSIIDSAETVKEIKEVENEMEKLNRIKKELASGEFSADTQAELDRIQAILDRKKQAEQVTQEQVTAEQQVVENARSLEEVVRGVAETQTRVQQELAQMNGASSEVADSQKQVAEDCSLAVREVERMKTALSDTNEIAEDLAYDLNMFGEGNKYSDDFVRLNKIAQELTKEFNKSADELFKMETLGDRESAEFSELAIKTAEIADQLRDVNGLLADMRASGEAYTEGTNTAELKNVERAYDAITNKITLKKQAEREAAQEAKEAAKQEAQTTRKAEKEQARLAKEAERAGKAMQRAGNTGSNAMQKTAKQTRKLNKEMKETNKHGNKIRLNFLHILGAAIGIRSLYALFNKLRSAVTDSMKTLAQMNNGNNKTNESISLLMNSLNQLKNALGAAFAPILTMVAPALNYLINLVTQAVNAIAQLIAYLSGSNTWLKAKKQSDDYAKSLKKTGGAAKDAAGKLAAFDDLNVLGKDNDNGGGGVGGVNPDDLFEEVPIEPWVEELFNKLKDLFNKLLPILKHIWDVFKQGFLDAAKDIKDRILNIIDNLKKIKQHLIDIFTDPAVVNAMKGWFDSLIYLIGSYLGAFALVGVSIAQNIVGGIEKYLAENKDRIKDYLIAMFNVWEEINTQLAKFIQAMAYIFSVIGDENGQQVTANLIGIFAGAFQAITLLASKLGRDILYLMTQPIIQNQVKIRGALNGILGAFSVLTAGIKKFTESIGDSINAMYDEHIAPFFKNMGDGISNIVDSVLSLWGKYVQPILVEGSKLIDSILNDYVMPVIQDLLDALGALIDIINEVWTKYLQPIASWFITNVGPIVLKLIQGIMVAVGDIIKIMLSGLSVLTSGLRIFFEFIRDIFTVGLIQAVINLKDNIVELVESLWQKITSAWENLYQRWTEIGNEINREIIRLFVNLYFKCQELTQAFVQKIKDFFTELKEKLVEKVISIKDSIITHWNILKTKTIEKFNAIRDGIIKVWEAVKSGIKAPLNGILEFIESMVNAVIDGLNFLISKINAFTSMSSKLPSNLAFTIEPIASLEHISIPRLAQGAVIPPNKEFLAMLGDQRSGTNIEAPLDTIRDAFADVVSNMQVQNTGYAQMELDGETFARLIVPYVISELNRQGYDLSVIGA